MMQQKRALSPLLITVCNKNSQVKNQTDGTAIQECSKKISEILSADDTAILTDTEKTYHRT